MALFAGEPFIDKQGFTYAQAISAQTVGSHALHMQFLTIPPGGRGKAHKHESHETSIYVLSGEGRMWWGEQLENHMITPTGSFVYIPANVPHLPYNSSATEPCVTVIARTDPNEQEGVVLMPELDCLRP